jgi:nitroimidazol reductase NimA-like FMN-containing flavoprotein (pyridoxamine 5'-phosphate oxidase superfamily)
MQDDTPSDTRLVELSPADCWDLAASRAVGRLAWTGPKGPTVIPVNFTVDGRFVRLRTSGHSEAARECEDSIVAFEVDDLDDAAHEGWSVLMRGRAEREPDGSSSGEPQSWVSGPRTLRLRIDVDEITGRALRTPS